MQATTTTTANTFQVGAVWSLPHRCDDADDAADAGNDSKKLRQFIGAELVKTMGLLQNRHIVNRSSKTQYTLQCSSDKKQVSSANRLCKFHVDISLRENGKKVVVGTTVTRVNLEHCCLLWTTTSSTSCGVAADDNDEEDHHLAKRKYNHHSCFL